MTWRAWIEAETGRRVVSRRRLRGGISAHVHAIRLDDGTTVVSRQWPSRDAAANARRIDNEVAALGALLGTEVLAPASSRPIGTRAGCS